jgi:hypothetical protein
LDLRSTTSSLLTDLAVGIDWWPVDIWADSMSLKITMESRSSFWQHYSQYCGFLIWPLGCRDTPHIWRYPRFES